MDSKIKYKKIEEAHQELLMVTQRIQERRKIWIDSTKSLLIESLNTITNNFKYSWNVQIIDEEINANTINICCNSTSSGRTVHSTTLNGGEVTKVLVKHGGYIAFSQSYNGKVVVFQKMPYIDNWITETNAKTLAAIEPDEITEEVIIEYVEYFLKSLADWENGNN